MKLSKVQSTELAEELTDFVIRFSGYYNWSEYKDVYKNVLKHLDYGTIVFLRDKKSGKIVAAGSFNVVGYELHIIDVVIHKSWRDSNLLKAMCEEVYINNPYLTTLIYRRRKYDDRLKKINLLRFLGGKYVRQN